MLSSFKRNYRIILLCFAIVMCVIAVFVIIYFNYRQSEISDDSSSAVELILPENEDISKSTNEGVLGWLDCYSHYDFDGCDALVNYDSSFRFQTYALYHGIDAHKKMYMLMHTKALNALDSIEVTDTVKSGDSVEHKIRVSYRKYQVPSGVSINEDDYFAVCEDYIKGRLVEEEFEAELTELYLTWLDNSYILSEDKGEFECSLIEEPDKDTDVMEVQDVSELISRVLTDTNTAQVEGVFESSLTKELDNLLKDY